MELTELLSLSIKQQASDLHISPGSPPILRINGDLILLSDYPALDANTTKSLIYSIMEKEQQQSLEKNLELDFAIFPDKISGFRINAFHQSHGIAAVFRIIPEYPPTLDQLEMPAVIKELLNFPNGLILITGPTGCGKSTTLSAMIDNINTNRADHIITIEDPIEFVYKNKKSLINQRQVHRDTHDFNIALRSALREDPDVILVGEMRDIETVRLALTAAETGHLVMATLHTNSAPGAISRIVDVFPTGEKNIIRNMLSESLRAVICQTLLKRISGGRIAALEIMLGTAAVKNLIREDKPAQLYSVMQTGSETGMCTLDQYLQGLVNKKYIDNSMAYEFSRNKELFKA